MYINSRIASFFIAMLSLAACKAKTDKNTFKITGTIHNSKAVMVYLEKVPAATMQPVVDDSAKIDKDGSFSLTAEKGESVVYNLRLDQQKYPVASVINDHEEIKVDITMSAENSDFAEKYEVTGSPASKQMKDYMFAINTDLQKLFVIATQKDSLQKAGVSDSLIMSLDAQQVQLSEKVKNYTLTEVDKAADPALILFELGYYQASANASGLGLEGITSDQVNKIINAANAKYPRHQSLAAIKAELSKRDKQEEAAATPGSSWVGQEAPGFTLPDVNGKPVSLQSYRGKYVLVDFWASWCGPCRQENPNVVKAYNQFKAKGFQVLGVSLDRPNEKDKWLAAIEKDKLSWTQVSDLKFWESSVVADYKLEGIPFNVLVDPSGKIIAAGLRGSALVSKLSEIYP